MILENNYWFFENVLSEVECNDIITKYANEPLADAVVIGDSNEQKIEYEKRKSKVCFIEERELFERISNVLVTANRNACWNFEIDCAQEIQFAEYSTGNYFDWHVDQIPLPRTMDLNDKFKNKTRKLTVCVALNNKEEYTGGNLEIGISQNGEVVPETCKAMDYKGSAIVFPSFLQHRVTEILSGKRFSLVMWGCGDAFR